MHNRKSHKTWVLKILLEKMLLEIPNPIVSILIDSIALVDKIFQRNLVERSMILCQKPLLYSYMALQLHAGVMVLLLHARVGM